MLKHTSKCNGFNLAENAFIIIAFFVLSSPCVDKNGFVTAFVLQQLPLYEAVASANEWPKAADENEQTDCLQQLSGPNNNRSKIVGGAKQHSNFHGDANSNGTTILSTPTSTKLLVNDGDDAQQAEEKKKFIATSQRQHSEPVSKRKCAKTSKKRRKIIRIGT